MVHESCRSKRDGRMSGRCRVAQVKSRVRGKGRVSGEIVGGIRVECGEEGSVEGWCGFDVELQMG